MRARKTERFEAELCALAAHVEAQGFETRGGFYAWERVKALVAGLQRAYDYFELEGDVAPVRREVEAYQADMANMGLRPEPWVVAQVVRLLAELEAPEADLTLRVSLTSDAPPPAWPSSVLTVRPETLDSLMQARRAKRVTGA